MKEYKKERRGGQKNQLHNLFYTKRKSKRQVFSAEDRKTGQIVAVKRYVNPAEAAPEREAMKAYGDHPNLVRLLYSDVRDKQVYLVMEWLEGDTIYEMVRQSGPVKPAEVVRIAAEVLQGLYALHRCGYVHGDLHGDNVIVLRRSTTNETGKTKTKKGKKKKASQKKKSTSAPSNTLQVTIIDFQHSVKKGKSGVAQAIRQLPDPPDQLAPESRTGVIDDSYDLYGVGYLCAVMLTGELVERSRILNGEYGDDPLWHVVRTALQDDPKQRYRSAKEMSAAMSEAT